MNEGYNLRSKSIVDTSVTPGSTQRDRASSPMLRAPLVEPAEDMSAHFDKNPPTGFAAVRGSSPGPPAPHRLPSGSPREGVADALPGAGRLGARGRPA